MNIVLVINKPAWSVGTLARLFMLGCPEGWTVRIFSDAERVAAPKAFGDAVRHADLTHWMIHRQFPRGTPLVACATHVISVFHLEEDEIPATPAELQGVNRIHVLSEECRQAFLKQGWGEQAVVRITPPVDESFMKSGDLLNHCSSHHLGGIFTRQYRRGTLRQTQGKTGCYRIGFFVSAEYNSPRKRIELLPEVSRLLTTRGVAHEFVVTGLGWPELLRSPGFAGLPIRHEMVPSYFDMAELYKGLNAYLCLSRVEGGPMPVFEALASGVPVVSTDIGSVKDYLHDGAEYMKIPFDDPLAAANALLWLRENSDAAVSQCHSARVIIQAEMSLERYQTAFVQLYADAAGKPVLLPAPNIARAWLKRRRWRAWDRSYWAKEMWVAGDYRKAFWFFAGSFVLDPFGVGVWKTPLGLIRRALKR